jgi:hypothetical protein
MTYPARKALNADTKRCVYEGCEEQCMDDCLLCKPHADNHRQRNLKWWHIGRKRVKPPRWIQLDLSSIED